MKKLDLIQMETVNGGYCTKTATKILMASASATIAAATGNIFWAAWSLFTVADLMTSGECENW